MSIELPSDLPRMAQPRCPYFGTCGGCALQDVEYAEQMRAKATALRGLLNVDVRVVPSPLPYHYRHKMEFVAAFGKLGFRRQGDYRQVVDLRECHLVAPRVSELLEDLHRWVDEFGIEGYDYLRHRGDLRYVVTRNTRLQGIGNGRQTATADNTLQGTGDNSKKRETGDGQKPAGTPGRPAVTCNLSPVPHPGHQLMVTLVTAGTQTRVGPLLERLAQKAESVVWAVNPDIADVAWGRVQRTVGLPHIRQKVGRFEFLLGPHSFFQNNLLLVEAMFEEIAGHVSGRVLDLFCGVGSIGIYCSQKAVEVIGVDSVSESIDLARRNAELNGLSGKAVRFVAQDADDFLRSYAGPVPDTVIVDPPRCGLSPRLIRKLLRLGPGRIVYVSCNPRAFAANLPQMPNYRLASVKAFDMFPQTRHVELVALLERVAYPPLRNQDHGLCKPAIPVPDRRSERHRHCPTGLNTL